MNEISIDRYDLVLLATVQRQGNATNAALGEQAHLSASQVSRRLQRLEDAKVISGYTARLDPEALGLGVTAYAQVVLERHDKSLAARFEREVAAIPEVLECYAVTGEADYMLRVVAPDLPAFSDFMMKRLVGLPGVAQVRTNIVLSKIKESHELPLGHVAAPRATRRRLVFNP